jgi:hypothetical protein
MSQEEIHIGKLRKIKLETDVETFCKQKCVEKGITEHANYYHNWEDYFKTEFRNEYFIVNEQVFEVFDHKQFDYEDIYYLKDNGDDTYDFVMKFYNGGTCLEECIEEELEKLIK